MFDANSRISSKIRTSAAISCKLLGVVAGFAMLQGCAVVGDVLPPALNLPARATDMTVLEHGDKLTISFKLPSTTTEGMLIRHPPEIDLRIGPAPGNPADANGWASKATRIPAPRDPHAEIPVTPWVNRKVAVSVRLLNERGKDAGWSPLVMVTVVPPLEPPKDLQAASQPSGVHLKWNSPAPKFRVFRHLASGPGFEQIATPEKPEYDDAVAFGAEYSYYVQALAPAGDGMAESDNSATIAFTPRDVFPPDAPKGLNFILGGKTIELTWSRNAESDLRGYRVYRAFENNTFERITPQPQESTSYSDRNIEAGKRYRYAISAVDLAGNESKLSEPVVVVAP
jgi:hypothetical protein